MGGGRWREGREEEGRGRREGREKGSLSHEKPFGSPSRGPSGALLVLVRYLFRAVYQSFRGPFLAQSCGKGTLTITGKNGDDSQRVDRVIQACGTHCHVCRVWTKSVPA